MKHEKSPSKAERVRQYDIEHPDSKPRDVAAALEQFGITAQYVSLIRLKDRQKGESPSRAPSKDVSRFDTDLTMTELIAAARFIKECGGLERAQGALRAAAEIANAAR
jgi:hypothetical protein